MLLTRGGQHGEGGYPTGFRRRVLDLVGHGQMTLKDCGPVPFVISEVFTFTGHRVSRIVTFHINLPQLTEAVPC